MADFGGGARFFSMILPFFRFFLPFLFAGVCAMKKGSPEEKKRFPRDFLGDFRLFGHTRATEVSGNPHRAPARPYMRARQKFWESLAHPCACDARARYAAR